MKISYLITCSDETDTLSRLIDKVSENLVLESDDIVILKDSDKVSKETDIILENKNNIKIFAHSLNKNYGEHKNYGIEKCNGDWIFQLDGDELPSDYLVGENLHELIKLNEHTEVFAVPRINDFRGVNHQNAAQWGWRLTISPKYNRPIVNWPDYQFRIFKKDYPRIRYLRRLHEKIEGYKSYTLIPIDENFSIYHDKTIEKQIETNIKYNKIFTVDENKGHKPV